MECEIYMGALDVERQRLNVFRMEMLGAKVHPAQEGEKNFKKKLLTLHLKLGLKILMILSTYLDQQLVHTLTQLSLKTSKNY